MTRQEKIKKGKLWQVYHDITPDYIIFEGNKTACLSFIKKEYGIKEYKKGNVRLGRRIYEEE